MTWALAGSAAVGVGSWALNKYAGPKKGGSAGATEVPQDLDTRNVDVKRVQGTLADFIQKYLPNYEPGKAYTGDFTAPMSGYEGQGLEFLQRYLNQAPLGDTGLAAKKQITDTLAGNFDPRSSTQFNASNQLLRIANQDAMDAVNRATGANGTYFSSERLRQVGDVSTRTAAATQKLIGDYLENERGRQMSVLPHALNLESYEAGLNLDKAKAGTGIGALPRVLEQNDLEMQYKDFTRQQSEFQNVVQAATGFNSGNPTSFAAYQPQADNSYMKFLTPLLSSFLQTGGQQLGKQIFCWIAAELFGGWDHPKTVAARRYILDEMPAKFKELYRKHGQAIAKEIKTNLKLREEIRPTFEVFALGGGYGNA